MPPVICKRIRRSHVFTEFHHIWFCHFRVDRLRQTDVKSVINRICFTQHLKRENESTQESLEKWQQLSRHGEHWKYNICPDWMKALNVKHVNFYCPRFCSYRMNRQHPLKQKSFKLCRGNTAVKEKLVHPWTPTPPWNQNDSDGTSESKVMLSTA